VSAIRLTHIGGPTVLLEIDGWRILTDPTFDAPGQRYTFGWGSSSRKVKGPAIPAAELGRLDAVLLTHDHHGDNLDDAGRAVLDSAAVVVTTTAGARRLDSLTTEVRGLDVWDATRLVAPGRSVIDVTATPCRHGPPLSRPIVGEVIGFALRWDAQQHGVLWISGDTVLYDGVREVGDRFDVDVTILHLGEARFGVTGPVRYSMTAEDGIELCRSVQPRTVVPVHYEGWSHFHQGREGIERALASAPDIAPRFRIVSLGTATDVSM
jgi:L-ascorbate metabolism protein UlaG (beta-lactamase superfamily)